MRPERVHIDLEGAVTSDDGSRIGGRIDGVVYLGMFTQFRVETDAGAILCHRLADEDLAAFMPGTPVVLTWPVDQTTLLDGAPPDP